MEKEERLRFNVNAEQTLSEFYIQISEENIDSALRLNMMLLNRILLSIEKRENNM